MRAQASLTGLDACTIATLGHPFGIKKAYRCPECRPWQGQLRTSRFPEKPLIPSPNSKSAVPDPALPAEHRIAWLTLVFGSAASAAAAAAGKWLWAAGLLIGALLAWLNFRWLRRGLDALVAASAAQAGAEKPRVPLGTYFAAAFRYGLIALIVYVIFKVLRVPLVSMVVGMCALAAAAIAASVYELWDSSHQ